MIPVKNLRPGTQHDILNMCLTGCTSIYNIEYICVPCKSSIYNGSIPKLSIKNNCGFPPQPDELKLYPVEEQIISPLMPFMTIIELPVGGQQALKGSICHVPVDISPTVNSLPRNLEDIETVSVKIKQKKIYKGAVFSENIHPNKVMKALYYLIQNSELYQMEDKHIDSDWRERLVAQEEMQGNDHCFSEKVMHRMLITKKIIFKEKVTQMKNLMHHQ